MSEPLSKYKNLEQAQVFDQNGIPVYGMDLELLQKQQSKHDPEKQALVQSWIEEVTGTRFPSDFQNSLKDGVLLCKLINAIKPKSVGKINTAKMPFMQMENISNFLKAAEAIGLQKHDSFMTIDLYEGKNLPQVVNALFMLASLAQKVPGYNGPKFGLAIAEKKEIKFTEEQLRNARAEVTGSAVASIKIDTGKSISREVVKTKETGDKSGTTFMSTASVKTGLEGKTSHRDVVKVKEVGDTSAVPLSATASMKVDTGKSISNEVVKVKPTTSAPAPAPSSGGSATSLVEDLEKLANLRDKGILTEEEFQAKKKQLLGL